MSNIGGYRAGLYLHYATSGMFLTTSQKICSFRSLRLLCCFSVFGFKVIGCAISVPSTCYFGVVQLFGALSLLAQD